MSKLSFDLSKNPQFSIHGQALATYTGTAIGFLMGIGLAMLIFASPVFRCLGAFILAQGTFHLWEYTFNALYHPRTLSTRDFLLPWAHSDAFLYAFVAALGEYVVEALLFPGLKGSTTVLWVGVGVVVPMQCLRSWAMATAAANFTHQIAEDKKESHQLVTHGVYKVLRHPSYTGWFYWAIGTQILLANPVCTVVYALAAWRFFSERIAIEEQSLIEFFGSDYVDYRRRTSTFIPFIP